MTNTKFKTQFFSYILFSLLILAQSNSFGQLRVEVYDMSLKPVSDDSFSDKSATWLIDNEKNVLVFGDINNSTDQVLVYEWPIIRVTKDDDYNEYVVENNGKSLLVYFWTRKNQVSITYSDAYVFYTGDISYPK